MQYTLTIKNHRQYVKRGDIKEPTWFSLKNDIFTHPDFFKTTSDDFKVFVWIISVCSKVNAEEIRIDTELCADQTKVPDDICQLSIEKLNGKRWDVHARDGRVTSTLRTRSPRRVIQTDRQTHTTNTQTDNKSPTGSGDDSLNDLHPLIRLWNENAPGLAKVKKSNKSRDKKIAEIFNELTQDEWAAVIKKINESTFCCGTNDRGWKADFDWLLKKETHLKVSEGKYDDRHSQHKKHFATERDSQEISDDFNAALAAAAGH